MRILQLCHKPPVPSIDGGCIAMNNITEGLLSNGCEVKVLTMETFKHRFTPAEIPSTYLKRTGIKSVFVDIKVRLIPAFLNLFTATSYNINRFYAQPFEALIIQELQKKDYDAVIFESLYTSPYLKSVQQFSNAKTIYRAHNVEHQIWEHHTDNERNPVKKAYLKLLTRRLKKYEVNILHAFDAVASITEQEAEYFKEQSPSQTVINIPVGMVVPKNSGSPQREISFFHIGSMDWTPNQDGIKWLLDEVWPEVVKEHNDVMLHLAGRKMPDWLLNRKQKQVKIHGKVADATDFMHPHHVMIVPLFSASGVRVKILEAMASGKTVLCTTVAAEGIPFTKDENMLIANDKATFVHLIDRLISGDIPAIEIGENARLLIQRAYDPGQIAKKLVTFFKTQVNP